MGMDEGHGCCTYLLASASSHNLIGPPLVLWHFIYLFIYIFVVPGYDNSTSYWDGYPHYVNADSMQVFPPVSTPHSLSHMFSS